MAKLLIVAVKDKVTGEFLSPIYVHNQEEAARIFKYQLTTTPIWKDNIDQFELHTLGMLNTETGVINSAAPEGEAKEILSIHPDILYKGIDILS